MLVVLSNVAGNCFLNVGVKSEKFVGWAAILKLIVSPALIAGVLLLIGWLLLRMALLSASPMTVALPITAGAGYILTGGIGQFLFAEKVPTTYDYGLILIVAGVLLVGTSALETPARGPSEQTSAESPVNAAGYQT